MRNYYLLLVYLLSLGSSYKSFAQGAPQLQWVFNAANNPNSMWGGNNEGKSIAVDAAGNRYVTGYFEGVADFDPSAGIANLTAIDGQDIFIAKYNSTGNYLWAKAIGGLFEQVGSSIVLSSSGEVYIAGYFAHTADFDPSTATANLTSLGGDDIFLAKYDSNGNYLWAKSMGGTGRDKGISLAVNSGGDISMTGCFEGAADFDPSGATANLTTFGSLDIFIAKYNSNGTYLWVKGMGGPADDVANAIALDGTGQIHITGYSGGNVLSPFISGGNTIFIAKYDNNGNQLWTKSVGDSPQDKMGTSLAVKSDGNVYVTGYFCSTADFDPSPSTSFLSSRSGSRDIFIAGYNSNGDYLWAKAMGGQGSDVGSSLSLDKYGDLWVTGTFNDTADFDPSSSIRNLVSNGRADIFIAKYYTSNSRAGDLFSVLSRGGTGEDRATSIVMKNIGNDHNVYLTGSFQETVAFDSPYGSLAAGAGASNSFIGHYYNSLGGFVTYRNAQAIGGYLIPPNEEGSAVATDSFGNVYVVGGFGGTADFNPSTATATLAAAGSDMFLAKYDGNGNYLWAKDIGDASGSGKPMSIAINSTGEVIIAGFFYDTADFDPSPATANLISQGDADIFIAKYDSNGNYLWAKSMGGPMHENAVTLALNSSGQIYIFGELESQSADFDPSAATANLYLLNNTDGSVNAESYIAKYDTNGNYIWAKVLGGDRFGPIGAWESKLAVNSNGEMYLAGGFRGTVDFDPSAAIANLGAPGNGGQIFIAKYDGNGNYLWAKAMGGAYFYDSARTIALNGSGEIYITGSFAGTIDFDPSAATANLTAAVGNYSLFMAKYDSGGNYIWAKATGIIEDIWHFSPSSLVLNSNNEMYISGVFVGTGDFDPSAAVVNLTSAGEGDIYIAKYDSSGNYLWAKSMGNSGDDIVSSIALNSNGELYATGYFYNTVDFEPANICNGSLVALNRDIFLAKYANATCTAASAPTVTHTGNTLMVDATADAYQWVDCNNGNIPVAGATAPSFTPVVNGNYAVVVTTGCCQNNSACQTVLSINNVEIASVTLYPNPTTGNFTIRWADALESAEIVVTDIMGKTIKTMQCQGQQEVRISLDGAANGIYFVRLQSGQKTKQFKLIKR